jgi:hypothetical protein
MILLDAKFVDAAPVEALAGDDKRDRRDASGGNRTSGISSATDPMPYL